LSHGRIAEKAECARSTVARALNAVGGLLTRQHSIIRCGIAATISGSEVAREVPFLLDTPRNRCRQCGRKQLGIPVQLSRIKPKNKRVSGIVIPD
jgi:hypothetical protein